MPYLQLEVESKLKPRCGYSARSIAQPSTYMRLSFKSFSLTCIMGLSFQPLGNVTLALDLRRDLPFTRVDSSQQKTEIENLRLKNKSLFPSCRNRQGNETLTLNSMYNKSSMRSRTREGNSLGFCSQLSECSFEFYHSKLTIHFVFAPLLAYYNITASMMLATWFSSCTTTVAI